MKWIYISYKCRGYLASKDHDQLDNVLQESARLYNAALQSWRDAYKMNKISLGLYDLYNEFTGVRSDDLFWKKLHRRIGMGVLDRFERSKNSFHRRIKKGENPGYPRFKSSRRWRTLELQAGLRVSSNGKIRIKGLPTISLKKYDHLPSNKQLKHSKITKIGKRIIVSLTYKISNDLLPKSNKTVGLDMGVTDRITLSNGKRIPRRKVDKLQKKHQRLSSAKKFSNNWKKRSKILSNAYYKQRVNNSNECHRITTDIIKRYGHIAVEALQIQNMTRSASGTIENPGKNVRAKSGLNREIRNQSWGIIIQQLSYKAAWAGRNLVLVDPKYTSQQCSSCKQISADSRKSKKFECVFCDYKLDADVNAARNILAKSLAGGNNSVIDGISPETIESLEICTV